MLFESIIDIIIEPKIIPRRVYNYMYMYSVYYEIYKIKIQILLINMHDTSDKLYKFIINK